MIRYNGPIETERQDPSLEYIRDIIFNKSEKYWKQGGGEPMRIPTCSYISREKAFQIINNFIDNKNIGELVEWIDLYEIEFDHGFNE